VKILVDRTLDAGLQKVIWDGTDAEGTKVPSGVYFYELRSEGLQTSRKLVIVY
jgi:flagellar hook assembly protein FlgD